MRFYNFLKKCVIIYLFFPHLFSLSKINKFLPDFAIPLIFKYFSSRGNNRTVNGCVRVRGGSRAFSSQLNASDFDANNLLPLMTEEKQCAGFNTGSESELRSCVVGGPLSRGRNDSNSSNSIERAAGAASLLGFTVSWSWRLRWFLWECDRSDKDARTRKSIGYAFFRAVP